MKRNHHHSAYISKWYNCINNHFTDYIHFITADIVLRKSFHWPRSDTHNRPKIVTTVSPSFVKTMVSSFSLQSKPKGKHCSLAIVWRILAFNPSVCTCSWEQHSFLACSIYFSHGLFGSVFCGCGSCSFGSFQNFSASRRSSVAAKVHSMFLWL